VERVDGRAEELEGAQRQLGRDLVTGRHPVLDGETAEILQQSALLTASFTPVVNLNSIHRVRQNYSHINQLFPGTYSTRPFRRQFQLENFNQKKSYKK
jgi:hypothetical protein